MSFPVNNLFCWRVVNGKQLRIRYLDINGVFLIVVRGSNRWNSCWITLGLARGGDEPASAAAIDMMSIQLALSNFLSCRASLVSCVREKIISRDTQLNMFESSVRTVVWYVLLLLFKYYVRCPCSTATWHVALDYLITHTGLDYCSWQSFFLPADEREDVQKKTFTKWVNSQLSKVRNIPLFIIASVHWLYSRLWLYCTPWSHCHSLRS